MHVLVLIITHERFIINARYPFFWKEKIFFSRPMGLGGFGGGGVCTFQTFSSEIDNIKNIVQHQHIFQIHMLSYCV